VCDVTQVCDVTRVCDVTQVCDVTRVCDVTQVRRESCNVSLCLLLYRNYFKTDTDSQHTPPLTQK